MVSEKKSVGVLSLYYKNYNYGGQLQSYALVHLLNQLGFCAEQICYDRSGTISPLKQYQQKKAKSFSNYTSALKNKAWLGYNRLLLHENISGKVKKRESSIYQFSEKIPHSSSVYNAENISDADYDFYVCGSDQIWNPSYTRDAYFLSFVKDSSKKISYAASIGRGTLNAEEMSYILERVNQLGAVSVREKTAQQLLKKSTDKDIQLVLDPTLLLKPEDWLQVCQDYPIDEKYVLTYFLGDDIQQRKCALEFAKRHNLKLVSFPYILGWFRYIDRNFGDIQLFDADPGHFISLIKNAEYVITDSFHATVFSTLFQKPFIVFDRKVAHAEQNMNSRIYGLLEILNSCDRIVNTESFVKNQYTIKIPETEYFNETFFNMQESSINFLKNNLI